MVNDASSTQQPRSSAAHNAQLAAIVTSSSDAIISLSTDWLVLTWNPGAEKMFGYTEAEAVDRRIEELILPSDKADEREQIFETVIGEKRLFQATSVRLGKDERRIEVEINAAPMLASNGDVFGASIVYRDVTLRNKETRRALAHAERLAGIRSAFSDRGQPASHSRTLTETTEILERTSLSDPKRLEAINASGLLSLDADVGFEQFTLLARQVVETPVALVTIVLPDRQVVINGSAPTGDLDGLQEIPASRSHCQYIVRSEAALVVQDAATNPLVAESLAAEQGLIAYLGVPIKTQQGQVLGAFCVLDTVRREWTEAELSTLEGLASLVAERIENRILIGRLETEIAVRRRTETRLRESENRIRMAARAGNVGFWELDLESQTYTATPEDFAHYGLPATAEPVQVDEAVRQLYFPEDRERIAAEIAESVRTGTRLVQEKRIRRPNGETRWLQVTADVRHDHAGKPIARYGATTDITNAKLYQEELASSESRFRRMSDNVPLILWMHGPDGKQEFVNQTYCDFFGVTREEMRESRWQLLTHPDDGTRYVDIFIDAVESRKPFHEEVRVRNKDNEWRWLESWARPHFAADGQYLGHIGASIDITMEKLAEFSVELGLQRLNMMLKTAQVGIGFVHPDGRVMQANQALLDLLGRANDDIANGVLNLSDHRRPEDAMKASEQQTTLSDEGRLAPTESIFVNSSGREVPTLLSAAVIDPEATEQVIFLVDLTQQKQHETQIQLLMQEVNHRSKNLLAVVQSIARQTARDANPSTFTASFIKRLQGLSRSQDLIIDGDWTAVGLEDLARSQLRFLDGMLDQRVEIAGPAVRLSPAAAQGIGMALHELATNALKYGALSNQIGKVALSWRHVEVHGEARLEISWLERDGPTVEIPQREGFGHTVIEQMAAYSVGGDVDLSFDPSGLSWTLTAPTADIVYR